MTNATSYNEQPSWRRLRDHGKFTSRAKLSRERSAFEATTASLRREQRSKKIRGLAARAALAAFVLSLTAACWPMTTQPRKKTARAPMTISEQQWREGMRAEAEPPPVRYEDRDPAGAAALRETLTRCGVDRPYEADGPVQDDTPAAVVQRPFTQRSEEQRLILGPRAKLVDILGRLPSREPVEAPATRWSLVAPPLARICDALWPVWYLVAFVGGSVAIGLAVVIAQATIRSGSLSHGRILR